MPGIFDSSHRAITPVWSATRKLSSDPICPLRVASGASRVVQLHVDYVW